MLWPKKFHFSHCLVENIQYIKHLMQMHDRGCNELEMKAKAIKMFSKIIKQGQWNRVKLQYKYKLGQIKIIVRKLAMFRRRVCKDCIVSFLLVVRRRPGEEAQAPSRRVLLGPDLPHRSLPEEAATHRPQHVHPRRPGAHLPRQDTLQSGNASFTLQDPTWRSHIAARAPCKTCSQTAAERLAGVSQTRSGYVFC